MAGAFSQARGDLLDPDSSGDSDAGEQIFRSSGDQSLRSAVGLDEQDFDGDGFVTIEAVRDSIEIASGRLQ